MKVFEVLYRAIALSFFASAISVELSEDGWFLKFFGCLMAALFWAFADKEARRA